jgi:hypothetical protein
MPNYVTGWRRVVGADCRTCSGTNFTRVRGKLRCKSCGDKDATYRKPKQTDKNRRKSNARAYANVYQRRGKIIPQPCSQCGAEVAEKHHDDYSKPLSVEWLCRPCHLQHHQSVSG